MFEWKFLDLNRGKQHLTRVKTLQELIFELCLFWQYIDILCTFDSTNFNFFARIIGFIILASLPSVLILIR